MASRQLRDCRCGARPGELHVMGCDMERCPRCGYQLIGCDCIYIICGLDPATLDQKHPQIYKRGPTRAMWDRWELDWGWRHVPWSGEYPGAAECREYGFWCVGPPWRPCPPDTPGAVENVTRLEQTCVWDVERQRFVLPEGQ